MRRSYLLTIALLSVCSLLACSKQPTDAGPVAESQPAENNTLGQSPEVPAETAKVAQQPAEPEMDYGDWLRLPEGLDRRYSEVYPTLVKSSIAGDASGLMNLAVVSQQIANVLARTGKDEEAYRFLEQSGRALRAGLPGGEQLLPSSTIANIFYNEGLALSRSGQLSKASAALNDAVAHGFTNLAAISNDDDLLALRESQGFAEQLEAWRKKIAETFRAEALHDLAAGESFRFELSDTAISGEEIDLEALHGKVVIVDIWGTWCPPCRAEIPSFIKLQDKFGDQGFQMVGLNYERKASQEENLAAVVQFSEEMGINYPCILGEQQTLAQVPSFSGYPTTLFIDKSGKVRMKAVGLHDYLYLEAVVNELLAE